ncbi:inositol monophosphatase [Streptomyces sp. NPDC003077]|uniref:inositol monophosphatase family protein n=1 Tax=Streptomyces sp. NPDC003077 TaxID=3154443 RepID=UPI0033AE5228
MSYEKLLAPMAAAAHEVGAYLTSAPRPAPAGSFDELRETFHAVERPAIDLVHRHVDPLVPGAPWAEELDTTAELPRTGAFWVVDVIDGAVQYLQGLPHFCVSLALVRDGEPVAAALHAPLLGETYLAAAGCGATRNGVAVTASAKTSLAAAVVGTSQPPLAAEQPEAVAEAGRSLGAVLPAVLAVRNLGPTSWQIADTGAGRLDAFWEYGRDDTNLLPGALVAREAGALVTDAEGGRWRMGAKGFVAAPGGLHGALLGVLAGRA